MKGNTAAAAYGRIRPHAKKGEIAPQKTDEAQPGIILAGKLNPVKEAVHDSPGLF
jgi:hypothetical protein